MKTILAVAGAAGLLALAACNNTATNKAAENKADAIESNAANVAEGIESNASNVADAIQANAANVAEAVRDSGTAANTSGNSH